MSIVFEDMGDAYEHIAQLENRIADLENDLNGRECWRCGYRVSGTAWESVRRFNPGGVRCVGCCGAVGDWHRHRVRELEEELGKRGSEVCELQQRVDELEREAVAACPICHDTDKYCNMCNGGR